MMDVSYKAEGLPFTHKGAPCIAGLYGTVQAMQDHYNRPVRITDLHIGLPSTIWNHTRWANARTIADRFGLVQDIDYRIEKYHPDPRDRNMDVHLYFSDRTSFKHVMLALGIFRHLKESSSLLDNYQTFRRNGFQVEYAWYLAHLFYVNNDDTLTVPFHTSNHTAIFAVSGHLDTFLSWKDRLVDGYYLCSLDNTKYYYKVHSFFLNGLSAVDYGIDEKVKALYDKPFRENVDNLRGLL